MAKATIALPEPDNNNCPMHEHYCLTCGTCNGYFDPITHERKVMTDKQLQEKIVSIFRQFEAYRVENTGSELDFYKVTKVAFTRSIDDILDLIEQEKIKCRLNERQELALDLYYGHTFSDSTDYRVKFEKFIKNNESRISQLQSKRGNK